MLFIILAYYLILQITICVATEVSFYPHKISILLIKQYGFAFHFVKFMIFINFWNPHKMR